MGRKCDTTEMVDEVIGVKINNMRKAMGLSRNQLSVKIGVTHQQLQKYEKGSNRITVGRLYLLAKAFKKPIAWFFEDIEIEKRELETIHHRMCIELARNFMKIKSLQRQAAIHAMVKTLANEN